MRYAIRANTMYNFNNFNQYIIVRPMASGSYIFTVHYNDYMYSNCFNINEFPFVF